jgi:myo-inositol-1(or 4)-monophosphatase
MKLLNLAARVARVLSASSSHQMRTVQKVKDGQVRDVVTDLDIALHKISEKFVADLLPNCRLLSEEGEQARVDLNDLCKGEWLVVDPLDGSSNHALGMPNYGYMAAHLDNGYLDGVVIVLPEHDQYIVLDGEHSIYSHPISTSETSNLGTVYYAYPPNQNSAARKARGALMELIDAESAGMYRYGSACAGLYNLLCGKHMAFIGHGIRLWDALAFLPLFESKQISIKYIINTDGITLVASRMPSFIEKAELILLKQQGITLQIFSHNNLKANSK